MRMKEAQTLGILAMIAVGIILLCMWGGGAQTEDPGAMADNLANASGTEQEMERRPAAEEQQDILPEPVSESEQITEEIGDGLLNREQQGRLTTLEQNDEPEDIGMQETRDESGDARRPREARYHVVARGDTLSTISQKYYDTSRHWQKLARINKDVCPNPNSMSLGTRLRIPYEDELDNFGSRTLSAQRSEAREETETEQTQEPTSGKRYVVKKGDSLYKIARNECGDGDKYKLIRKMNRDVLDDGDLIKPGMVLQLPTE